jgi:PEP-CTERM motif
MAYSVTINVLTFDWDRFIRVAIKVPSPSEIMKILENSFAGGVRSLQSALVVVLCVGYVAESQAQTLSARNTSITFNLSGANVGITDWTINGGGSLLNNQWFYYGVGSGPIYTIDQISSPSAPVIGGTSRSPTLSTSYANSDIGVSTLFTLGSGLVGSPTASLSDTITISNPSALTQVYHFYQYSFFPALNQTASFTLGGVGYSFNSLAPGITISAAASALSGGTSVPSEVQTGVYDGTQFGLINGASALTLNNTLNASGAQVDFAYEWDATLAPGGSITISELQSVTVPEPSSLALLGTGILALVLRRRKS